MGLTFTDEAGKRTSRDPTFRKRVLTAYEHRCAVCGLQIILTGLPVGLDAAHIKWHQAGGPAQVTNGLALCSLHHKTFDLGAFTVSDEMRLAISDEASGTDAFERHLLSFHGKKLRPPIHDQDSPNSSFLAWHRNEVFLGKPRPANKGAEA